MGMGKLEISSALTLDTSQDTGTYTSDEELVSQDTGTYPGDEELVPQGTETNQSDEGLVPQDTETNQSDVELVKQMRRDRLRRTRRGGRSKGGGYKRYKHTIYIKQGVISTFLNIGKPTLPTKDFGIDIIVEENPNMGIDGNITKEVIKICRVGETNKDDEIVIGRTFIDSACGSAGGGIIKKKRKNKRTRRNKTKRDKTKRDKTKRDKTKRDKKKRKDKKIVKKSKKKTRRRTKRK